MPATLELQSVVTDGIAWIELNRPERGNALSAGLVERLIDAIAQGAADQSVHTIALCGAGRHFCTGFDMDGLDSSRDGDLLQRFVRIETLLDSIWRAPVRTVAIVQGRAIGAGADLCVACDHRVLAPGASLRFPGAGFGIVLGTRRLAARVGRERALTWVSEGRTVDAPFATDTGLASVLAPPLPPGTTDDATGLLSRWRADRIPPPPTVERVTLAALKAALSPDGPADAAAQADTDLAALVRSAARPGLHARLVAYRDRNNAR